MNIRLTLALLLCLTLLSACHSSRQAVTGPNTEIPADISLQTPAQRAGAICASYAEWDDVSLPIKASISSKNGLGCSGKAAMKRGQWISISLRMLGFEVASLWIDTDSVHAVDRYHKMYISESIASLMGNTAVTVSDIQDLLMGRAFLAGPDGGTLTSQLLSRFSVEQEAAGTMLIPRAQPAGLEYGFLLSPDVNGIMAASAGIADKYPVTVTYSGFVTTRFAGSFASMAEISFPARKISGSIQWEFGSARWNTGLTNSWSAPKGYRRITSRQLLQTLSSF